MLVKLINPEELTLNKKRMLQYKWFHCWYCIHYYIVIQDKSLVCTVQHMLFIKMAYWYHRAVCTVNRYMLYVLYHLQVVEPAYMDLTLSIYRHSHLHVNSAQLDWNINLCPLNSHSSNEKIKFSVLNPPDLVSFLSN